MSRSGYTDDIDSPEDLWAAIRWAGALNSAIKGGRGQAFFRRLAEALDSMEKKELIAGALEMLEADNKMFCALGVAGQSCGDSFRRLDPYDHDAIATALDIAPALAREVAFQNDECGRGDESPAERWKRMRRWVDAQRRGLEPCFKERA